MLYQRHRTLLSQVKPIPCDRGRGNVVVDNAVEAEVAPDLASWTTGMANFELTFASSKG
jgi:hypothetical protein